MNINANTLNSNNSSYKLNNIYKQIQNGSEDRINIMKNKIKRKLVKTKYSKPQMITWKINDIYINSLKYEGKKNFKFDKKQSHKTTDNYYNNKFLLTIKECKLHGNVVGYYFFFKRVKLIQIKHDDSTDEVNYFKRYASNTEGEQSDYKTNKERRSSLSMKQINKSNTEQTYNKSGFYLSQQILNKEAKENNKHEGNNGNAGTEINFKKSILHLTDEDNKNHSNYLISDYREDKDDNVPENDIQEKYIPLYGHLIEKNNELKYFSKLKSNFIPLSQKCFEFDLDSMSYLPNKIRPINNYEDIQNKHQISKLFTF